MTTTSYSRGHLIEYNTIINKWVYSDTKEFIENNERPCKKCGKHPTPEGYDACLGFVPGVKSVCCGHGIESGYSVLENGEYIRLEDIK